MSSTMTLTGRLTALPELRFSPSGVAVAAFTVVTSRRVKDQNTGEWSDADTTYWDCKAFKQLAQNLVDSLDKGMEVIVVGRAVQESWEDKQTGQKRSKIAVRVDAIGPSLRNATAKVTKAAGSGQGRQEYAEARQASSREGREDPWATSGAAAEAAGGWDTEPPF
ncbi:single-stranded DNA-binding protein [Streptomyces sp. AS02]|uniref:single-stranded DNA-binding protein n=1 Tax=Streptomyces sp. AS02 TaxID=2938946 RepID=UPI002020E76E|nr:single-stranded DNA-binding protein [Streptomyces sp. AS02]MCL8016918.1 single-stranded DNA-binding protein [Streptomyces sp. AS02]